MWMIWEWPPEREEPLEYALVGEYPYMHLRWYLARGEDEDGDNDSIERCGMADIVLSCL